MLQVGRQGEAERKERQGHIEKFDPQGVALVSSR